MLRFLFFYLLLVTPLFANEEIIVHLPTQKQLIPVQLDSFADPYAQKLRKILEFDLNQNGHTEVVDAEEVRYKITGSLKDETLHICCTSVRMGTQYSYQIPLTGKLGVDRYRIHQLSDTLQKELFGTQGIATTRILYTMRSGGDGERGLAEVWMADYDGGNAHPVTQERDYCVTPAFLPPTPEHASGAFFYVCYQTGQPKIYLANLRGGKAQPFTSLRGNQFMPTSTKQRDLVAFISDAAGNPDLFIQRYSPSSGSIDKPVQVFSAPGAAQASPTFSPDGKRLAFVSNKDGSARIYIIDTATALKNPKGAKLQLISRRNRENTSPCWSPDGTKIAYCGKSSSYRQIWLYDLITGEETQLTDGPGHKENPSWGPDSLHLVFNSAEGNHSELYLINLNQSKAVRITSGKGEKRFPAWEPR